MAAPELSGVFIICLAKTSLNRESTAAVMLFECIHWDRQEKFGVRGEDYLFMPIEHGIRLQRTYVHTVPLSSTGLFVAFPSKNAMPLK